MKMRFAIVVLSSSMALGAAASARPPADGFPGLDFDSDGKVAISEIEGRAAAALKEADANKDGYVTKAEMEAFHEARRAEHLARRFPDADGDGFVSRREFEDAARARFDELDQNGDGLISKEEIETHQGWRRKGR